MDSPGHDPTRSIPLGWPLCASLGLMTGLFAALVILFLLIRDRTVQNEYAPAFLVLYLIFLAWTALDYWAKHLTADQDGIHTYRWGRESLTPWTQVELCVQVSKLYRITFLRIRDGQRSELLRIPWTRKSSGFFLPIFQQYQIPFTHP